MSQDIDWERIAEGIGAERVGRVESAGGYFGAMQLAAEVTKRFKVPHGGGRRTDPEWTERRLIPLSPDTLKQLEEAATRLQVTPLQLAAILLEKAVSRILPESLRPERRRTAGPASPGGSGRANHRQTAAARGRRR